MKEKFLLMVFMFLLFVSKLYSQVPPPPNFGEESSGPGAQDTPIDHFGIYLLAIGVVLGIVFFASKRMRKLA